MPEAEVTAPASTEATTTATTAETGTTLATGSTPEQTPEQTEAAKVEAGKAAEAEAAKIAAAVEAAKPKAPEKYDIKLPEGVAVDVEPWTDTFKSLGLTNDQAQALVNQQLKLTEQSGKQLDDAIDDSRKEWRKAAQADKDIGGANFTVSMNAVKSFLGKFGDAELSGLLDASGLGDHPAFLRALAKAGKALAEDRGTRSNGAGNSVSKLFTKSVPIQAGA